VSARRAATSAVLLEVVTVPVSDIDRALAFYRDKAGFVLDVDYRPDDTFRVVQLTPPGSATSVHLREDRDRAGTLVETCLVVNDIEESITVLVERGLEVSGPRHKATEGGWRGGFQEGVDPERADYATFAGFSDPDGNTWLLQERGYRPARGRRPPSPAMIKALTLQLFTSH
jgi:catechol 2,3-dioxygenase-like lactoylglutathione lyase family enzyme